MANDTDMWNDIEELEKVDDKKAQRLQACLNARYVEFDEEVSEKLKGKFQEDYNEWGNYY